MHWQTTCRTSWTPWVWRIFNLLITTRAFSGPVRAPRCLHSPVPTWGHRSQLRPQALPTVQQHMSWVRYLGSACSQPLDSDAIRKQWACSAGDSAKSHTKEEKHAKTTWWGAVTRQKKRREENQRRPVTHRHTGSFPEPFPPCRSIWSCPECSDSRRSDRRPAWSTRWYL